MRSFTIKELERFANIKAHTIRAWELRYNLLSPERNAANIRSYNLDDLKYLLQLSLLISDGYKVSKLAAMNREILDAATIKLKTSEAKYVACINELIINMYSGNTEQFELLLNSSITNHGIDNTIQQVIVPFLEKVDLLSYEDTSIEVHFAVTVIRKKIIVGIESVGTPRTENKPVLLFLPKDEHYDLVLLYLVYMLKLQGIPVLYLGTNISNANLERVIQTKSPEVIYTYFSPKFVKNLDRYLDITKDFCNTGKLFVGLSCETPYKKVQPNTWVFYFKDIASTFTDVVTAAAP